MHPRDRQTAFPARWKQPAIPHPAAASAPLPGELSQGSFAFGKAGLACGQTADGKIKDFGAAPRRLRGRHPEYMPLLYKKRTRTIPIRMRLLICG